ncbi:MAG: hypothetical protein ABI197_01020 [Granulicella sp.]
MPTIIGIIFFCCAFYCFLYEEDGLLGLLIISGVFEAASAINIAERGIQPYYVVAAFIIARGLINRFSGTRSIPVVSQGKWLLAFGAISLVSAFVFPYIFAGTPIYDPKIGIDDGLFNRPPLSFSLNNVVQASYLLLHIVTAFSILAIKFSGKKTRLAFLWAFYIEAAFLVAESFCQLVGITFPLFLVLNNPGYSLWQLSGEINGTRNPGTFAEPSLAGVFLVVYCIGFLAEYLAGKGKAFRVIASLIASGLVASSSSLLTICLVPGALLLRYSPFRFPYYVKVRQAKRIAWIATLLIIPVVLSLAVFSGYRELLTTLTISKGDSGSFINRTASDLYSLQLLIQTHGMGVGLGSNRSSSLLSTLVSNVGIAGTLAFLMFYCKLFVHLPERYAWFGWAGFAMLLNMCLGIADVTIPLFWIPILLAIQFSAEQISDSQKTM